MVHGASRFFRNVSALPDTCRDLSQADVTRVLVGTPVQPTQSNRILVRRAVQAFFEAGSNRLRQITVIGDFYAQMTNPPAEFPQRDEESSPEVPIPLPSMEAITESLRYLF
jgi:hypothetical protein